MNLTGKMGIGKRDQGRGVNGISKRNRKGGREENRGDWGRREGGEG